MNARSSSRIGWLLTILLLAVPLACGTEEGAAPTSKPVPAEELATRLVEPADLGTGWSIRAQPNESDAPSTGVVPEQMRDKLPRLEFCSKAPAAAHRAAAELRWLAFRQLDLDTGLPPSPPASGERPAAHLVFVQEFLTSDTPAGLRKTYDALASGMRACLNTVTEYRDGETGHSSPLVVPPVGEDRVGTRERVTEPGGPGGAVWDLRTVLFRTDQAMAQVLVADVRTPGITREIDQQRFEEIIRAVARRLG